MKKSQTAFLMAIVLTVVGTACAQGGRDAAKTSTSTTGAGNFNFALRAA
ncbi:MAG TPA: hypothetical protein VEY11_04715 [Pyrinomonadaceae bacterium]|nr:hypothetical protein [Pyrinomonadaceae bacterium]